MLSRYLLAMNHAEGRRVLDSCSGLGWGSYLVAGAAAEVVGIDRDSAAVAFCRRHWKSGNLKFLEGSVLELPFEDDSFDIVMCMEAIEHFSVSDGRRYLSELGRVCRPGGMLLGSSAFPRDRAAADQLCSKNEHHLHVYTRSEMRAALKHFGTPVRLTPHYFAATKA
jgi:ubiquinone/menaquinone biosynthesis C-methylase UbiE